MPMSVPVTVSAMANQMLTRKPYSSRASMSRPLSSVPSQLIAVGPDGAGSLAK